MRRTKSIEPTITVVSALTVAIVGTWVAGYPEIALLMVFVAAFARLVWWSK